MIQTFDEFVLSWWNEYLSESTEENARAIMENEFLEADEDISDYLAYDNSEARTCRDWLMLQKDANYIYSKFFGYEVSKPYDNLPTTADFLVDLFIQAARWYDGNDDPAPDFARECCFEMAGKAEGYSDPLTYFNDLHRSGCASDMVSMFIYNTDCKQFYIEHIDDMEEYIEQIEEETGAAIKNRNKLPHYTFVCWVCFKELAFSIARSLFPDKF